MKSDIINDVDLISRLKDGDSTVMEEIYRLYWKSMYQSAYAAFKDKEACEDIIQELFIRIWENRLNLNINYSIQAYLSASVRYEVYRKIKTTKKFEPIIDKLVNDISCIDYHHIELQELQIRIATVVNDLSPKCKEVYLLSRNKHLPHKEIAAKLNISTKTVRNHLTNALHQLRLNLQHYIWLLLIFLYK